MFNLATVHVVCKEGYFDDVFVVKQQIILKEFDLVWVSSMKDNLYQKFRII